MISDSQMNPTRCVQASFSHHVLTANSRNTGALAPAPMGIRQDLLNPRQRKRRNWKKESEHRAFSPSELVNLTNHSPTKAPLIKLCSFPRTTLTINHKLGGFNRNSFSHRSGCQKPEIKAFWGHTLKKKALGENPPSCLFHLLVVPGVPWLVAVSLSATLLTTLHCNGQFIHPTPLLEGQKLIHLRMGIA